MGILDVPGMTPASLKTNAAHRAAVAEAAGCKYVGSAIPSGASKGDRWLSYALADLHAPHDPKLRFYLGVSGQEQNVWVYNNTIYNLFTDGTTALAVMSCPISSDFTYCATVSASISGSTLTVSAPTGVSVLDIVGEVRVGATVQSGSGATVLPFGTNGTTGTGGYGTYALSGSPGNITNTVISLNFWTAPTRVIGGGNGGVSGNAAHSYVYQEGDTLYCYWISIGTAGGYTNQNTYVSTASVQSPYSWTPQATAVLGPQGQGTNGNPCVAKQGATYYMYQECLHQDSFPVEGTTNSWQTVVATAPSPLGPFTVTINPIKSLRPGPNGQVSGSNLYYENGSWVNVYHGGAWARVFPNDIFRAVNSDLSSDSWVLTDRGLPMMRRFGSYEIDQVADASVLQLGGGVNYLFYSACDNRAGSSGFRMKFTPLLPTVKRFTGSNWVVDESAQITTHDPALVAGVLWSHSINAATAKTSGVGGTWAVTAVSGAIGGYSLQNSSAALNDYVQFDVNGWAPGTYTVEVVCNTGPDKAVCKLALEDGADAYPVNPATQTVDMYSSSATQNVKLSWTVNILGKEVFRRKIMFTASSKNASSSGYGLSITAINIARVTT